MHRNMNKKLLFALILKGFFRTGQFSISVGGGGILAFFISEYIATGSDYILGRFWYWLPRIMIIVVIANIVLELLLYLTEKGIKKYESK